MPVQTIIVYAKSSLPHFSETNSWIVLARGTVIKMARAQRPAHSHAKPIRYFFFNFLFYLLIIFLFFIILKKSFDNSAMTPI